MTFHPPPAHRTSQNRDAPTGAPLPRTSRRALTTYRRRCSRWTAPPADERGSVLLYMVPITLVLLLFAGLVFDGGTALAAQGHALDVAQQAARAGANAITPESLRTGGPVHLRIDPPAAQAAARQVLTAGGATGTVTVDADVVTVTAQVCARTAILSAIGIQDASGQATASAIPIHGIDTGTDTGVGP